MLCIKYNYGMFYASKDAEDRAGHLTGTINGGETEPNDSEGMC